MAKDGASATRYVGLDIHKDYLVAVGVDCDQHQVNGPDKIMWSEFERWRDSQLTLADAVVFEMTTNAYAVHDALMGHVHSVTAVHPPHAKVVTQASVKTDAKAALALASLYAAKLLPAVWVPPHEVRELRAVVAQRHKMVRLATQAKNRLHVVLHRYHFLPPEAGGLFDPNNQEWWLTLPVSTVERVRIKCDLETLAVAKQQIGELERYLGAAAAQDERVPLLIQLGGFGLLNAIRTLAAIGTISRFPSARKLVGYAGLGASVQDSGKRRRTGGITKEGRRDLRAAAVEAASHAVHSHPHWKAEYERLRARLGRGKAIVAIARKLLTAVWHVLTNEEADRFAEPQQVATALFNFVYRIGVGNLPTDESAKEYVRRQLDRLGLGADLTEVPWGSKPIRLPPSKLTLSDEAAGERQKRAVTAAPG